MIPVFGDETRRKINLGGTSSATTQAQILGQAKARRNERLEQKRRQENALRIQAWWRGAQEVTKMKEEMRRAFEADPMGLTGLRCLVLIGQDEEILGRWSLSALDTGEGALFRAALGNTQQSWSVLVRQICMLLLRSLAVFPESQYALAHLKVLNTLLDSQSMTRTLGTKGSSLCLDITYYLINRQYHSLISRAILSIPVESKASPSIPPLITLITLPLVTLPPKSHHYTQCLYNIFLYTFAIPLLPNRLPLDVIPRFVSKLPLDCLEYLKPHIAKLAQSADLDMRVHIVANLYMFISPHYSKLLSAQLSTYLCLFYTLLNTLPSSAFDAASTSASQPSSAWVRHDSDSDADDGPSILVTVVSDFNSTKPPTIAPLDPRTRSRLQKIPSTAHMTSLLNATRSHPNTSLDLVSFLLAVTSMWPSERDRVLSTVLVLTGGGLVRQLYREHVRRSPLGKNENSGTLLDPVNAFHWPPLLFLADLYSQALLTMGDDEFFGTNSSTARNPLSLDELTSFSRQLLNIAFALYWKDDQSILQQDGLSGIVNCTWEGVRDKVKKCLLGIHARDSRKSFTPSGHWLVTSHIDMQSFIEAAVFEEQQLSKPDQPTPRRLNSRQIAIMSPRLGILNNIPFAIPFEVRVSIFRHFVMNDMMSHGMDRHSFGHKNTVQVRRGMVAQDGFDRLAEANLKAPIEIAFIDLFGNEEAGIDGGGVFKEFFTSLCKEVFDTDRGLWLANKKNELYPNPHAYATEAHSLNWYRFIGRILGKAMYEGILVDVAFANFFLAKWLGKQSFLDDLASLDPDLYNGLIFLKHYTGNPEELSLNFTVAIDEFGVTNTIDLIPNGSNIPVTRENRLMYMYLVSHFRLSKQIKLQSEAFFEGLSEMIDPKWLRMFNQQEVQILLGGVNAPIDLADLREHTNYGGLYDDNAPTILAFWKVINSFDQEQRRALLRFVTSCSRPPLLGFKELIPNFAIRDAGEDQHRLPTSSTCVNLLKLPRYTNERVLREKLLQAIYSGAGFDLS